MAEFYQQEPEIVEPGVESSPRSEGGVDVPKRSANSWIQRRLEHEMALLEKRIDAIQPASGSAPIQLRGNEKEGGFWIQSKGSTS